jgi:hypothetical protein
MSGSAWQRHCSQSWLVAAKSWPVRWNAGLVAVIAGPRARIVAINPGRRQPSLLARPVLIAGLYTWAILAREQLTLNLLDAFCGKGAMDTDLDQMTREELIAEVKKLRKGIREHRDSSRHELCWHHPSLWGLLPERTDPLPVVPEWPEFIRGCVRYRQSLDEQAPNAPRTNEPYEQ